jgi:hypothetical protein
VTGARSSSPTSIAVATDYAQKRITCADSALSTGNETIDLADYTTSIATPISQRVARQR